MGVAEENIHSAVRISGWKIQKERACRYCGTGVYIYNGPGHAAYEEARDFNKRVIVEVVL